MFLFYVLSITLCLSSVSTCVCVIFNPVGTFLTIAGYLFYALVSSLLLALLSIPLVALYFDNEASPESRQNTEPGKQKPTPKQHHEMPAPERILKVMPIQEEHPADSPTRKLEEPTLTEEAFYKVHAPLVHEAECERLGRASPGEAQATPKYRLITPDEFTADPAAYGEGFFIPRLQLVLGSKKGTGIEERIKKQFLTTADHAAASKEPATQIDANALLTHVETTGPVQDDKPTTRTSGTIEEESMDRTTKSSVTATVNIIDDDAEQSSSSTEARGDDDDGPRGLDDDGDRCSSSSSLFPGIQSQDSAFRVTTLRGDMGVGVSDGGERRRLRGSSSSSSSSSSSAAAASVASCPESEFRGLGRKAFMLENVGEGEKKEKEEKEEKVNRARSAGW